MSVFPKLMNFNLQILTLRHIKHNIEKHLAIEIISMSLPNHSLKKLLYEKTKCKDLHINKNDYIGLEFTFRIIKESGIIKISLHKKRYSFIIVTFYDKDKQICYRYDDTNELWLQMLLLEFDTSILQYIKNGFSGKIKGLKIFIEIILRKKMSVSVYVDIPGCIIII